jgi:hypothetical protein
MPASPLCLLGAPPLWASGSCRLRPARVSCSRPCYGLRSCRATAGGESLLVRGRFLPPSRMSLAAACPLRPHVPCGRMSLAMQSPRGLVGGQDLSDPSRPSRSCRAGLLGHETRMVQTGRSSLHSGWPWNGSALNESAMGHLSSCCRQLFRHFSFCCRQLFRRLSGLCS